VEPERKGKRRRKGEGHFLSMAAFWRAWGVWAVNLRCKLKRPLLPFPLIKGRHSALFPVVRKRGEREAVLVTVLLSIPKKAFRDFPFRARLNE